MCQAAKGGSQPDPPSPTQSTPSPTPRMLTVSQMSVQRCRSVPTGASTVLALLPCWVLQMCFVVHSQLRIGLYQSFTMNLTNALKKPPILTTTIISCGNKPYIMWKSLFCLFWIKCHSVLDDNGFEWGGFEWGVIFWGARIILDVGQRKSLLLWELSPPPKLGLFLTSQYKLVSLKPWFFHWREWDLSAMILKIWLNSNPFLCYLAQLNSLLFPKS